MFPLYAFLETLVRPKRLDGRILAHCGSLAVRFGQKRIPFGFLLMLTASLGISAQAESVDLSFSSTPLTPAAIEGNAQQEIQPDGKILVYNSSAGMFRLNSDGTTDTTFSYCNCGGVGISNVKVGPDGKIILAGTASPNHAKMIRLNPDGSIDNSFSVFIQAVGPPEFTGNWLTVDAIQADGKVVATHGSWGNIQGTWYSYSMRRYNLNATVDPSFAAPQLEGGHLVSTSALIEPLPDGRFYLAVSSRSHLGAWLKINRRNADGTPDPTFTEFTRSLGGGYFLTIGDLSLTNDGGLLATGTFWPSMIGGPYPQNVFRFTSTGGFDPSFSPPPVYYGTGVHFLPDGKMLFSAAMNHSTPVRMMRLTAGGVLDDTYVMDPAISSIENRWQADALGRPIFLAQTTTGRRLVRLLENGSIDPSFNPQLLVPSSVNTVETQSDGKVLLAGPFSYMNGTARNKIARVNSDGSLDAAFDPGSGFTGEWPSQMQVQPDGKILAAGAFTGYNGTSVPGIVRINGDGTIDNTFAVSLSGSAYAVALQPDGKILIGGNFTTVNGVNRAGVARLNPNGTVDETFTGTLTSPSVRKIIVETSGKITVAGAFTAVNGIPRNNLARLESNGTLDPSFSPTVNALSNLWQQPDGKYLITGGPASTFVRLNNNGSPDAAFTPPAFGPTGAAYVWSVLIRPDGTILVGGRFDTVGGLQRRNLTRLRRNGMHDATFIPNGADGDVSSMAAYAGDKVMAAGAFRSIHDVGRIGIARLNIPAVVTSTPFDFDGDGKAEVAVYRPSSGIWYQLFSSGIPYGSPSFGLAGDIPVPADYDADGKTDLAIFRPSTGDWWWRNSTDGALRTTHWGQAGDRPLPADLDNDGKADFVIFRPSNNYWYRITQAGVFDQKEFGLAGDKPLIGDFDGDGKPDRAIFRPSTGDWWYTASASGDVFRATHWGQNGDIPAPADFDGDGQTDHAVFRPSEGGWYILHSSNGTIITTTFGLNGDRPIPADYDGDGKADIAVFRPSTGVWYLWQTTAGTAGIQWGIASDVPVPNAFIQP